MRLHVELQRRPRLLALTGGDDLAGLEVVESTPGGTAAVIEVGDAPAAALAILEARGLIRKGSARPEKQLGVLWLPGPLDAETQWVPGDTFPSIGVTPETQRRGRWGAGVRVALLDTGLDGQHPWFAPLRVGGQLEGDLTDSHGHGTHVAGILTGIVGVAPAVHLRSYTVLPGGSGSESLIASGIRQAVQWRAAVINMSLGGVGYSGVIADATNAARQAGVIVVSAAGNGGSAQPVGSPASSSTYAVMASGRDNNWASFSDGRHTQDRNVPRIAAPGVEIVSAAPGGGTRPSSGTSMSAPEVAGMVALLLGAA
jgi:subtilisin family serine protease